MNDEERPSRESEREKRPSLTYVELDKTADPQEIADYLLKKGMEIKEKHDALISETDKQ